MSDAPAAPTPTKSAETLSRIRSILDAQGGSPDAALDAIAQLLGRREPAVQTYQKPWG